MITADTSLYGDVVASRKGWEGKARAGVETGGGFQQYIGKITTMRKLNPKTVEKQPDQRKAAFPGQSPCPERKGTRGIGRGG